MADKLAELRVAIQEGLRVQRGSGEDVTYIDTNSVLADVCARQNHVVFARRGCGKSLLLHYSAKRRLAKNVRAVYLNCEDFKRHSFPNVLVEILDALFCELETHLSGWFGKKRRSGEIISSIRAQLNELKAADDVELRQIRTVSASETDQKSSLEVGASVGKIAHGSNGKQRDEIVQKYEEKREKLALLDLKLPHIKAQVRELFELSGTVKHVYLQIDDLYHLRREDQPFVVDYVHRLCKDVPLFFKIATLRHASVLFVDRDGQPIGAQERHDFQPIDIDYTFKDFKRTRDQNKAILDEYGTRAGFKLGEIDALFKGEGFDRLVLAGGGVPRDVLSLFLQVLSDVQANTDKRIGKDDVRILSKSNLERRIEELKADSDVAEQGPLIRAIYVIREFCLSKETNVFLVAERDLQQADPFRSLIYRLLDYRIIHHAASALTNKSQKGTYQAFAIDIGCYAHLRKHEGKFRETDLSRADSDVKDVLRSAPILELATFDTNYGQVPDDAEIKLLTEDVDD